MIQHSAGLNGAASPLSSSGCDGAGSKLSATIEMLLQYCRGHDWAGYDPYDALNSRLLRKLGLLNSSFTRLAFTQLLKRSPVNLRGLLLVPKEQNPKGIAVFLSALVRLSQLGLVPASEARALAGRLLGLRSKNQPYACWGYNFGWQTRNYLVPHGTPNIICTTFAANALLDAHAVFGDTAFLAAAVEAGNFLLEGLNFTRFDDSICFSYTPLDHSQIHNANLLGAALLARLHSLQPTETFRCKALQAVRYSLERQRPDGSWPYGEGPKQQWVDSFHTGYNLVALERVRRLVDLDGVDSAIRKGYTFYLEQLFEPGGVAKYFHNRTYPVDAHSIAQAFITLVELRDYDERSRQTAIDVYRWTLRHMRDKRGWFYYQKRSLWTNKIPYMRWCQAWMLLGLAHLSQRFDDNWFE